MARPSALVQEQAAAALAEARAQQAQRVIGTCVVSGHRTTFMAEWLRGDAGLCWWCWVAGWSLVRAGWRWVNGVLVRG